MKIKLIVEIWKYIKRNLIKQKAILEFLLRMQKVIKLRLAYFTDSKLKISQAN